MLNVDQVISLGLTVGEVNVVMAALQELPFKLSAPVIDRLRQQILAVDPDAFTQPQGQTMNGAAGTTVVQ